MKCPYNRKSEKHVNTFTQENDENNAVIGGKSTDFWGFELMDCLQEDCGVWHDGKCCYAAVSLENK